MGRAASLAAAAHHLVGVTSNTLEKATALLPALLYERLEELGIDFAVIYPSFGLSINGIGQDTIQTAAARAYNRMTAEMFASCRISENRCDNPAGSPRMRDSRHLRPTHDC